MLTKAGQRAVGAVALTQLLTAVPFLLGAIVVGLYGRQAQQAAEAETRHQGISSAVLTHHGISFGASAWDIPLAAGIAAALAILATLNLAARPAGRIASYVAHPILFVAGLLIVPGQIFTTWYLRQSITQSTDPALHHLDVPALVAAAQHVFPAWLPYVSVAKLLLTTLGSVLVVILLSTRRARAYYRRSGTHH